MGWWKLNEGSGSTAVDLSGNGNNGTWNGTQAGTSGYYSPGYNHVWAGQFDGSTDYIDLGNPAILTANYITVACWVKPSSFPSFTTPLSRIASNGAPAWEIFTQNNQVGAEVDNGSTYASVQTGSILSAGIWTHVAFTYDGNTLTLYVNGALQSTAPLTGTIAITTVDALIGKRWDGNYFPGEIDDVQIYNIAVTAAQVNQLYTGSGSSGSTPTTTSLTSSQSPSNSGSSVTFTATVSPSVATGTVTFYSNGTSIGTGTLSSGSATLTISTLAVGSDAITTTYGGDGNYSASTSSPLTQTVNDPATSSTSVNSSSQSSNYGVSVTFTATVTPAGATGTVKFYDFNGAITLGYGTLNGSSQASLTILTLAPGAHSITAAYGGGNYPPSTSPVFVQTVNRYSMTLPPYAVY